MEGECVLSRDVDELGKRSTANGKIFEDGTAFGGADCDEVDSATEVVFGREPRIFVVERHAKKLACAKAQRKNRDSNGWAKAQHLQGL